MAQTGSNNSPRETIISPAEPKELRVCDTLCKANSIRILLTSLPFFFAEVSPRLTIYWEMIFCRSGYVKFASVRKLDPSSSSSLIFFRLLSCLVGKIADTCGGERSAKTTGWKLQSLDPTLSLQKDSKIVQIKDILAQN